MDEAARLSLTNSLIRRYKDGYKDSIQQQLDHLGIRKSARDATGQELARLERMAANDAASITSTYNSDLERRIDQLIAASPDASLESLKTDLRTWQQERAQWKDEQISRSTQGHAYDYATDLFIRKNRLLGSEVIWYAVPAIIANSHQECIRRVRLGAVPFGETADWERPHPNCRHRKQVLIQTTQDLRGEVWRG